MDEKMEEEKVFCQICSESHPASQFEHVGGGWRPGMHKGKVTNWITLRCLLTGLEFMQEWDDFEDDDELE